MTKYFYGETKFFIFPRCEKHIAQFGIVKKITPTTEKYFVKPTTYSNFFSKTIVFTKFLRKKCEREFLQFPHSTLCVRYIDITNPLRNYEEKHLPTNCLRPKYSQRKIYELLALIKLLFPKQERNVKTFLSKILLFT